VKQILIAWIAGGLVTGGSLGTLGYFHIQGLKAENTRLATEVKKQKWQLQNMSDQQARLSDELAGFKDAKNRSYEQTIGALMQAKDNASLEALYEIGVKALSEKDAPLAYFALDEVHKARPKYKDIAQHYPAAQQAYNQHKQTQFQHRLDTTYAQALDQQASQQFAQAKNSYQMLVNMKPDFKDAKIRLETVTRYLAAREQTRSLEQKKQWLETTYRLGFDHQAYGRYSDAQAAYAQIVHYAPQYKDSAKRLAAVRAKLPKTPPLAQANAPAAPTQSCYEQGLLFGKCAVVGAQDPTCSQLNTAAPPTACQKDPEFIRGFQATSNRDPSGLLRGLSSFLKEISPE